MQYKEVLLSSHCKKSHLKMYRNENIQKLRTTCQNCLKPDTQYMVHGWEISITWDLVRNADSQAPSQTLNQNLHLSRFPRDSFDIEV